jgi:hypothetical protein
MAAMDMTDKLWDLANLTTGFAVAQSIATSFALAKGDFRFSLRTKLEHIYGIISTVIFMLLYMGAVLWCWSHAQVTESDAKSIWGYATFGRVVAIFLFSSVTIVAFLGHSKNVEKYPFNPNSGG